MTEATKIREEFAGQSGTPPHQIRMNLVITEVPSDVRESPVNAHMDTTDGEIKMDLGHLETPELTVTLDYDTAKAIFVEQNPQAGMQAFMAGKIKVQGDMTKLMAMQQGAPDPTAVAVAGKIKEITD
jgi:putative sterol carrier protein